jgi:hypothetical protein
MGKSKFEKVVLQPNQEGSCMNSFCDYWGVTLFKIRFLYVDTQGKERWIEYCENCKNECQDNSNKEV